ncbi:unnamed protein product [Urochloa humidicola]
MASNHVVLNPFGEMLEGQELILVLLCSSSSPATCSGICPSQYRELKMALTPMILSLHRLAGRHGLAVSLHCMTSPSSPMDSRRTRTSSTTSTTLKKKR